MRPSRARSTRSGRTTAQGEAKDQDDEPSRRVVARVHATTEPTARRADHLSTSEGRCRWPRSTTRPRRRTVSRPGGQFLRGGRARRTPHEDEAAEEALGRQRRSGSAPGAVAIQWPSVHSPAATTSATSGVHPRPLASAASPRRRSLLGRLCLCPQRSSSASSASAAFASVASASARRRSLLGHLRLGRHRLGRFLARPPPPRPPRSVAFPSASSASRRSDVAPPRSPRRAPRQRSDDRSSSAAPLRPPPPRQPSQPRLRPSPPRPLPMDRASDHERKRAPTSKSSPSCDPHEQDRRPPLDVVLVRVDRLARLGQRPRRPGTPSASAA